MMRCLLDLDGVLIDFLSAAHQYHGLPYSYSNYPYELGSFANVPPAQGTLSTREFWDAFDRNFWVNLPWIQEGHEILRTLEYAFGRENICLLTSPTINPESIIGKIEWIKRELPDYKRRYLVGPAKHFCAGPDTVLVDDTDKNINAFKAGGGQTILVPRPWNSFHICRTIPSFQIQLHLIFGTSGDLHNE